MLWKHINRFNHYFFSFEESTFQCPLASVSIFYVPLISETKPVQLIKPQPLEKSNAKENKFCNENIYLAKGKLKPKVTIKYKFK